MWNIGADGSSAGAGRQKSFVCAARFCSAKNVTDTKNFCVASSLKFKCRHFYRALQTKSFLSACPGGASTRADVSNYDSKKGNDFYGKYH